MYIAIAIMLCGIILGRIFRAFLSLSLLHSLTSCAIFLLLFLLGASIGGNAELLSRLPEFGWHAILLMLCGIGGSIGCCLLLNPLFRSGSRNKSGDSGVQ